MIGIVSESKSSWPGDERPGAADRLPLQPDHTHYVAVPSCSEEELSSLRFGFAQALALHPWHEVAARRRAEAENERRRLQLLDAARHEGVDVDEQRASSSAAVLERKPTTRGRPVETLDEWDVEGQQGPTHAVKGPAHAPLPCVSLIVSGGAAAMKEALKCVRYEWPLVVVKGTGGVADRIAAAISAPEDYISDPDVTEIVQEANIEVIELAEVDGSITGHMLKRLFTAAQSRHAAPAEPNVIMAWDRIREFEQTASRHRSMGRGARTAIILLALTSTTLACTNQSVASGYFRNQGPVRVDLALLSSVLRVMLLVVPIVSAAVRSYSAKARSIQKCQHLRAAAEELRSEIYRYRTCTGIYNLANLSARNGALAEAMKRVNAAVANSVASEGGITSLVDVDADGDGYDDNFRVSDEDDGVAELSPDDYIALRIVKERDVHRRKAAVCERALGMISVGNYVLGGVGTYLSTLGRVRLFVSVTTAVSTALISVGEEERLQDKLAAHTRAVNEFNTLVAWWRSLSAIEKANPQNFAQLVENAEDIMLVERKVEIGIGASGNASKGGGGDGGRGRGKEEGDGGASAPITLGKSLDLSALRQDIADNVEPSSGAVMFRRGWVEKHNAFFDMFNRHMEKSGRVRARDPQSSRKPALVGLIQHAFLKSSVISRRTPETGADMLDRWVKHAAAGGTLAQWAHGVILGGALILGSGPGGRAPGGAGAASDEGEGVETAGGEGGGAIATLQMLGDGVVTETCWWPEAYNCAEVDEEDEEGGEEEEEEDGDDEGDDSEDGDEDLDDDDDSDSDDDEQSEDD